MTLISDLTAIVGADHVHTDEETLKLASVDNYRKLQTIFDVHTMRRPEAVVYAGSTADVAAILEYADANGVNVVARTGGTATEGGLESGVDNSIVVDGSRMDEIISVDAFNMQATVQCGVPLQALEDACREVGLTTGHSPQSKPIASMGGLVATRSRGQLSTLYGGIEDMVVGCEVVFPGGDIARIKNVPRRAAGPDIRHLVIGNEGALCYITEVTVKLFPFLPQNNVYMGWTTTSMADGFAVLREVMVAGFTPAVARLYDFEDGQLQFSHIANPDECTLIFTAEGNAGIAQATAAGIREIVAQHPSCKEVDSHLVDTWFNDLTWGPDKVQREDDRIRDTRNVNRTTEVSADWSAIQKIYDAVMPRLRAEIPGITLLGGHSSHSYINGTNMYFNYFYDLLDVAPEDETEGRYLPIINIIVEETLRHGGSIVHHHGMGKARAAWVRDEYGSSYPMLAALKRAYDPNGVMNMGTIIPINPAQP